MDSFTLHGLPHTARALCLLARLARGQVRVASVVVVLIPTFRLLSLSSLPPAFLVAPTAL